MKSTYKKNYTNNRLLSSQQGFTFIELIVVMSIFSLVASVVLFNFSSFNTNITSQNLAQEIALQIKQAQTDSISGTRLVVFPKNPDNIEGAPTYGVRFDIDTNDDGSELDSKSMAYFADRNSNGGYDHSGSGCDYSVTGTECVARIQINTGDIIAGICVDSGCDNGVFDQEKATILFRRPFPEARLYIGDTLDPHSKIGIKVRSSKGAERVVTTTILGQINVMNITTQ